MVSGRTPATPTTPWVTDGAAADTEPRRPLPLHPEALPSGGPAPVPPPLLHRPVARVGGENPRHVRRWHGAAQVGGLPAALADRKSVV